MPLPKPSSNESENEFMSRCMSAQDGEDKTQNQKVAICQALWRDRAKVKNKESDPDYKDVVGRLEKVKSKLIQLFGENGKFFFDYTMIRLGLYSYPEGKSEKIRRIAGNYNLTLKGNVNLPYVKEENGCVEFGNVILAEHNFTKIDKEKRRVSGYANTIICDLVDDMFLPESYMDSAKNLKETHFMHHLDLTDGKIVRSEFDDIGWFVETEPDDWCWQKVLDGTIKGYSIGGRIVMYPKFVGAVAVFDKKGSVIVNDLSHVTRPCNKLSFFQMQKMEKSEDCNCGESCELSRYPSFIKSETETVNNSESQNDSIIHSTDKNKEKVKKMEKDKEDQVEETKEQTEVKDMNSMSNDEILKAIEKNIEIKQRNALLKTYKQQQVEIINQEKDAFKEEITEKFAKLNAKLESVSEDLITEREKRKLAEERLKEIEDAPSKREVKQQTSLNLVDQLTQQTSGLDHDAAWELTEAFVKQEGKN